MLKSIILLLKISLIWCECGLPSLPYGGKVRPLKSFYQNGEHVKYYCEHTDLILIGNNDRVCNSSRWIGKIPQCLRESSAGIISRIVVGDQLNRTVTENKNYPNAAFYGIVSDGTCLRSRPTDSSKRHVWVFHLSPITRTWKDFRYIKFVINAEGWSQYEKDNTMFTKLTINRDQNCQLLDTEESDSKISFMIRCDSRGRPEEDDNEEENYNSRYYYWDVFSRNSNITLELNSYKSIVICEVHLYESLYYRVPHCGTPDISPNTYFDYIKGGRIKNGASYYRFWCNEGFQLIGPSEVICNSNSRFEDDFPTCRPKYTCPMPQNNDPSVNVTFEKLINSDDDKNKTAIYGSIAIYSCVRSDAKMVMMGDSVRFCSDHGRWTGIEPTCIQSNKLSQDRYKEITDNHALDSSHFYKGFDQFSSPRECGLPAMPMYTRPRHTMSSWDLTVDLRTSYPNGTKIYNKCEISSNRVNNIGKRQCIDGSWKGTPEKCTQSIKNGVSITSVQVMDSRQQIIKRIQVQNSRNVTDARNSYLLNNYVLYETNEIKCPSSEIKSNQRWKIFLNDSIPITEFHISLKPGGIIFQKYKKGPMVNKQYLNLIPVNAEINGRRCVVVSGTDYDKWWTTISFNCELEEKHYSKYGEGTIDLIFDHHNFPFNWTRSNGFLKLCMLSIFTSKSDCGSPDEPLNAIVTINSEENKVLYACEDGYQLNGPSEVRCGANGKWLDPFPSCVYKELCHQNVSGNELLFTYFNLQNISGKQAAVRGSIVINECVSKDKNVILVGSNSRICTKDGKWSENEPYCIHLSSLPTAEEINSADSQKSGQVFAFILVSMTCIILLVVFVFFMYKKGNCFIKPIPPMINLPNCTSNHLPSTSTNKKITETLPTEEPKIKEFSIPDLSSIVRMNAKRNCLLDIND